MERDREKIKKIAPVDNFNSHAHVERDLHGMQRKSKSYISTHTLTWSVTMGSLTAPYTKIISTHTLTWSVTNVALKNSATNAISTHTLTWSVTLVKLLETG